MGKKNEYRQTKYRRGDGSVIDVETQHVKKGRLKGANKKQTRILRGSCVHHVITKNGKIKGTWSNNGKGQCQCYLCKATWPTKMLDKYEVEKKLHGAKELVNQAKFISQAINADRKTVTFYANLGASLEMFPNEYNNIKRIVEKRDSLKKKKKKGGNSGPKTTIGYWSVN